MYMANKKLLLHAQSMEIFYKNLGYTYTDEVVKNVLTKIEAAGQRRHGHNV